MMFHSSAVPHSSTTPCTPRIWCHTSENIAQGSCGLRGLTVWLPEIKSTVRKMFAALFCQRAYESQHVLDLSVAELAAERGHRRRAAHRLAALGDDVEDFLV